MRGKGTHYMGEGTSMCLLMGNVGLDGLEFGFWLSLN